MKNLQFSQTVQAFKTYSLTSDNFYSSCRIQGMTKRDFEQWAVSEVCTMSDMVKAFAVKPNNTLKSISAVWRRFTPNTVKSKRTTLEWAIAFINSAGTGYSNYLKKNGLDPKTCMAFKVPVKSTATLKGVEGASDTGASDTGASDTGASVENEKLVTELEQSNTVLQDILELAQQALNNKKATKATLTTALNAIVKQANA